VGGSEGSERRVEGVEDEKGGGDYVCTVQEGTGVYVMNQSVRGVNIIFL
jgi:hypothetical protein